MTEERIHRSWLLGVLLTGPFMAQADVTIVNVATPSVHADLGASGAALQLVVGGYLIAVAMLLITGARLGQAYGYRRAFLAGVSLFTAASLACGLAPDPAVLIVARVVQGAGAGVMFPQTLTGIQLHFAGPDRVRAIGRYALALSAGAVSGQILGGLLVSANVAGLGWRAVFLVNVPIGVLAVVAALRFLPADATSARSRLDLAGVALLSVSVLLLVLPLTLGRSAGWPAWAWACLAASLPAGMAFLAVQDWVARRGGAPLVNLHLFAIPVIRWGMVTMMTATSTYGCLLLAAAFAGTSGSLLAGQGGEAVLLVSFGFGGLGLGIQFEALTGRMTAAVRPRYAPDISGVSSTLIQIGGSIGVAAIGALYLDLAPGAAHATHAFGVTTAALAGLAVLASAAAFRATRPAPIAVPAAPHERAALQETRR
jgi:MFS family permease